ncbi:MAG: hypothetical protein HOV80_06690 [Polyangiaceae bacterium]|nr:hypothetical protein [Polyangiaceae bacterium]
MRKYNALSSHVFVSVLLTVGGFAACSGGPPDVDFGDTTSSGGPTSTGASTGAGGDGYGAGGEGAGGEQPMPAPALRNPVDMSDGEVAYQSLILMGYETLGATTSTCTDCHALSQGLLKHWRDLTDTAVGSCFADPSVPMKADKQAALDCMQQKPGVPNSPYLTPKLGVYAAAAHLDWFTFVFDQLYGAQGPTEHADFMQAVAMPKEGNTPWTQGEFDIVAEWFARGLPFLEQLLPDDPPVMGCTQSITPDVAAHVEAMATTGWRAVNAENGLLMFGCAGAATPLDCLGTYPQAGTLPFGSGWEHLPGAKLRVLRTNFYNSSYWTRSSADGRFVGHGGGVNGDSTIVDLQTNTEIAVNASYDPGFFPDNSGFIFQSTPQGTGICTHDLLTSSPSWISFNEPECENTSQVGLYQHVGAALGGGDYWAVAGSFVSDNGGHTETLENPAAFFSNGSDIELTPMVYDGTGFSQKPVISISTPFEGDTVMSPSSQLLIGRVGGGQSGQAGFRLRKMIATPAGNSYTVQAPEIARDCFNGGKPGFSYDERWAVIHRYVTDEDAVELGFTGPNDPAFNQYKNDGAANVYLLDLVTGLTTRITHMHPGQYALFPHFRSDGWIYFMVRTVGSNSEYIVASDAALVVE